VGRKRKKVEVPYWWRNKERKKLFSWKRRLIFFRKRALNARNVGIRKRIGFSDKRELVMNPKQGFLLVQNVSIVGGNIRVVYSSDFLFLFPSRVFSSPWKSILTIVNYVLLNEKQN
jgi:hypothetical protein